MNNSDDNTVLDIQDFTQSIDANTFPDEIKNFTQPNVKTREQKRKIPSNFMITINSNISHSKLQDTNTRIYLSKKLASCCENIKHNLANGNLLYEHMDQPLAKLIMFKYSLEIGTKKGFLHAHAICSFNGWCQIKLPALKSLCNTIMSPDSNGCFTHVQAFKDNKAMIESYISKHNSEEFVTLYKTE